MNNRFAFVLVLVLASSSLIVVGSVSGVTKPSVPEFTVKPVDNSYVVPPSTSIDPYTGQQINHPSYTVENKTIDITIKNQPFVPPDNLTNLYYGVRVKGHFEESWTERYYITNSTNGNHLRIQSASENTVISIPQDYPQHGQVDFQVEAVIATAHPLVSYNSNFGYWTWEASDWSNTQTITIGTNTPTATPESSENQSGVLFGFNWEQTALVVLCILVIVLVIVDLLVHFKKRKHEA
jgi:hypothetical protein